jgi:hypothetical protein
MTRKTRQNDAKAAQKAPQMHVLSTKTCKKACFWAIQIEHLLWNG